jgi:hypothetical protein
LGLPFFVSGAGSPILLAPLSSTWKRLLVQWLVGILQVTLHATCMPLHITWRSA